jgi:hypothetical protein
VRGRAGLDVRSNAAAANATAREKTSASDPSAPSGRRASTPWTAPSNDGCDSPVEWASCAGEGGCGSGKEESVTGSG